jgi:ABC-type uncharacterized transport system permease subunit
VRRIVQSQGYARTRVGIGAVVAVLGAVLLVRTAASVGLDWRGLPAYVLGAAMIALGIVRWREYQAARRGL